MLVYTLYLLDVYTRVNNYQQAIGDQHSDVVLGLNFLLTSLSKTNYIYCFKPPYTRDDPKVLIVA